MIQADAAEKARKQALTGYNYLTEGPGKNANNAFINYGTRGINDASTARAAQMELLGLGPMDGGSTLDMVQGPDGTYGIPGGGGPGTGGSMLPSIVGGSSPSAIRNYWNGGIHANPPGTPGGANRRNLGDDMRYAPGTAPPGTGGPMAPLAKSPPGTGGPMPLPATGAPMAAGVQPGRAGNAFNNYLNSTGYQFQLGQGQDAIVSNGAARGMLRSGSTAKALTKYGQDLASTTFNNYLSQLGNVGTSGANAGVTGQNELGMVTNAGTNAGSNAAGYITDAGNAWTQGINGTLGNVANIFSNLPRPQVAAGVA